MGKYRIYVYAISKNESVRASRWAANMNEADGVYVLDTGSTDNTVAILRDKGVNVTEEVIEPFRFDVARNRSMELIPEDADICVCTDLDEVFENGWRDKLESLWKPEYKQLHYRYTWNFNPDGTEGTIFWYDKIHAPKDFIWKCPVHEHLQYTGDVPPEIFYTEDIKLFHHADPQKSRTMYLDLLNLGVREDPHNERMMHYLGREYMFCGKWEKCIETLERYLAMPEAVWSDERSTSMRYIAKCYEKLEHPDLTEKYYMMAIGEAPHLREPWVDMEVFCYKHNDWYGVAYYADKVLSIKERPVSFACEGRSWGTFPLDLASIAYSYMGHLDMALKVLDEALKLKPDDKRLLANRNTVIAKMNENA